MPINLLGMTAPPKTADRSAEMAALDSILTWQLLVAWAGEGNGELQRLGWWRIS